MNLSRPTSWGSSHELLQQLVDAAPTALIMLDFELAVLDANREACDLLGRRCHELLARPIASIWTSERLGAAIADMLENAKRGHLQVDVEGPVLGENGLERWTRWTASVLHEGGAARLLLSGRDITELRSLEQRRSADDALSRIAATCDSINQALPRLLRALCRTLGWDIGELWTVDAVAGVLRCDGLWAVADLDPRRLEETRHYTTLRRGEGLAGVAWARGLVAHWNASSGGAVVQRSGVGAALAFPVRGRDEIFAVVTLSARRARSVDADLLAALDSLGSQIGLLFDRIRARENLRRTEAALRALHRIGTQSGTSLESKLDAVVREGCQWFCMQSGTLFKAHGEELERIACVGCDGPEASEDAKTGFVATWLREVGSSNEPVCLEHIPSTSSAFSWWKSFIGMPLRVEDGWFCVLTFWGKRSRQRRFSATDREILGVMAQWMAAELERSRLQQQLVEGERLAAVGMTAATFAHEVSNPLTNMALACELIARDWNNPAGSSRAGFDLIKKELGRLGRLLDEFRALSRGQVLELEPACLRELSRQTLADFGPMFSARGIAADFQDGPRVDCIVDREKLRQVVVNLIKNAIEAMPKGGTLRVEAVALDHGGVRLQISDTGCGIPSDIDVFAPFASTKREGTGLGLAVVRQLVSAHQGQVSYHSVPGAGTTFVVELPASRTGKRQRQACTLVDSSFDTRT